MRSQKSTELLLDADRAATDGRELLARERLRQFFDLESSPVGAAEVLRRLENMRGRLPARTAHAYVARSITLEPLIPLIRAAALLDGVDLQIEVGGFNTWAQDAIDPGSGLYRSNPDIVFLTVDIRDVLPVLWWGDPVDQSDIEAVIVTIEGWIRAVRAGTRAAIVVTDFAEPARLAAGLLDAQSPGGQAATFAALNGRLRDATRAAGAFVLSLDALSARHGRVRWHDERKWLTARMPISAGALAPLAHEYARLALAVLGVARKVLVLDLDNTLWGGVIGEDGVANLRIGSDYAGAGYQGLQRVARGLRDRGVLLAIASKNNEADAIEVLDRHPQMLLRRADFAAVRINWNDKAQSLREMAAELNVGLDSLVFVDDNPAERERIRSELPEVLTIELPADSIDYAAALAECGGFERLSLSAEDRDRSRLYAEQRERAALARGTGAIEDFYRSLDMRLSIARISEATLARAAQLTQKTNQFNVTTRRYGEEEMRGLLMRGDRSAFIYGLADRFGDNGRIGIAIATHDGEHWDIDTLLLSCRVIGRTVESAMLAHVADSARRAGAKALRGWVVPTAKNAPARDVYERHGFRRVEMRGDATHWELDLARDVPDSPPWIQIVGAEL